MNNWRILEDIDKKEKIKNNSAVGSISLNRQGVKNEIFYRGYNGNYEPLESRNKKCIWATSDRRNALKWGNEFDNVKVAKLRLVCKDKITSKFQDSRYDDYDAIELFELAVKKGFKGYWFDDNGAQGICADISCFEVVSENINEVVEEVDNKIDDKQVTEKDMIEQIKKLEKKLQNIYINDNAIRQDAPSIIITPNGTVIDTKNFDTHGDFLDYVYNEIVYGVDDEYDEYYSVEYDEYYSEGYDYATEVLNFMTLNTGDGFYEVRCKVVMDGRPSVMQVNLLGEWLEKRIDEEKPIIVFVNGLQKTYEPEDDNYSSRGIIKSIQRSFLSGILESRISNDDIHKEMDSVVKKWNAGELSNDEYRTQMQKLQSKLKKERTKEDKEIDINTDDVFYRFEIEGKGSLFQSIDEILHQYVDEDGYVIDEFEGTAQGDAVEDLKLSLSIFDRDLPEPDVDLISDKLKHNRYRSAFTQAGYDLFKTELDAIKYDLDILGYKLNKFKVNPKSIVYEDTYQIVYTNGDKIQMENMNDGSINEAVETNSFTPYTAGYILEDGSLLVMDEYHGEEEIREFYPEYSNTHPEEDTCVRIYIRPTEAQYKRLEEIIDYYLDHEGYCKVEIWEKFSGKYNFYEVYSLYEGACEDSTWNEKIGNWTGYKLVQIIKNYFAKRVIEETIKKSAEYYTSDEKLEESKQDVERFTKWAGKELADRYFKVRNRLQREYKDITWIMKNISTYALERDYIEPLEKTPTRNEINNKGKEGAELVYENSDWKVYKINNYEASIKYGKGTKWCITGSNTWAGEDRCVGRDDFDRHTENNSLYFYLSKKDKRKYALEFNNVNDWALFNEEDYLEVGKGDIFKDALKYMGGDYWNPFDTTRYPTLPHVKGLPDIQKAYRDVIADIGSYELDENDYIAESLSGKEKEVIDTLDKYFGQKETYVWSTYILPNGHFLNPGNYKKDDAEWQSSLSYEHEDFDFVLDEFGFFNNKVLEDYCIKVNVTFPYVAMPNNRATPEQFLALRKLIDRRDEFEYSFDEISNIVENGSDVYDMKAPLIIILNNSEIAVDLDSTDVNSIVKMISRAYTTGTLLAESKLNIENKINRYYATGTLVESDFTDFTDNEQFVYHGSPMKIDKFKGDVVWFTDNIHYAREYTKTSGQVSEPSANGYIYKCTIDVKRPFDIGFAGEGVTDSSYNQYGWEMDEEYDLISEEELYNWEDNEDNITDEGNIINPKLVSIARKLKTTPEYLISLVGEDAFIYNLVYSKEFIKLLKSRNYDSITQTEQAYTIGVFNVDKIKIVEVSQVKDGEDELDENDYIGESLSDKEKEAKEDIDTSTYYRLELINPWNENMGGIFNSIWSLINHPDNDEDSADELEDIINDLMNRHDVPSKWLGEDVKFAFKDKFIKDKINSELIKDLEFVLNDYGYKLLIDEIQVKDADIVWQDENQIAFEVK